MFTIRLRKGSKTGAKVGEFGKFATQAEAIAQAQILADGQSWAPGIKVVVEKVRGGAPSKRKKAKAKPKRANKAKRRKNGSTVFSGYGAPGGMYYGRRDDNTADSGKIVKMLASKAKRVMAKSENRPIEKIGVIYWVPPEYVRANEAKGRVEGGWIKPVWTWDGLVREPAPGTNVVKGDERTNARKRPARKNTSAGVRSTAYKGHQIRKSAAGYTVLPYGHVFPSLTAARAWLTEHVAVASKRNPKGGRLLAAWGKREGRAVGKALRSNAMTSYKGHAYNINAGVYSTTDPLTGKRLTFRNRLDLEHFLDRAFMARARSARGSASAVANTRRRNGRSSVTQSVLFPVSKFSVQQAHEWLRRHGKMDLGVDTTGDFHRYRQLDPGSFQAGSFRTISLGRSGVKAIIGRPL